MTAKVLCPELMSRREAMLRMSAAMGGTFVGAAVLVSGCASSDSRPVAELFTSIDLELLDEISETILPATDTPGAKAAGVGQFMAIMVADAYRADEQKTFFDGLQSLQAECIEQFGQGFLTVTPVQRTRLLERLDREQFDYMNRRSPNMPVHYFRMFKELTLQGYFTSEIGYTQAMRYVETPGLFDPCATYALGDRAWADHA